MAQPMIAPMRAPKRMGWDRQIRLLVLCIKLF
jgi:hypothetical protein